MKGHHTLDSNADAMRGAPNPIKYGAAATEPPLYLHTRLTRGKHLCRPKTPKPFLRRATLSLDQHHHGETTLYKR